MATARFGDQEYEVGNACPRNPAWARAMSEVLPPAAFLRSEVLRSVAGCPSVRPSLEAAGVEFAEEDSRRGQGGPS